ATMLDKLGWDPSFLIGGVVEGYDTNGKNGEGGYFVCEADESDGTLALYRAQTLVITSIDFDHPEHFKSLEAYRACYDSAASAAADVIRAWELDASGWPELEDLVHGRHNVMNARAAIEVALRRGYSRDDIASALPSALDALPDRRFERICPLEDRGRTTDGRGTGGILVYTDYAHHPAELKCAVGMAAELNPQRLRILFQPHRYSRTKALLNEFPSAFAEADEVVLIPVYPAFEEPVPGGDIADLYKAFRDSKDLKDTKDRKAPALLLSRSAEEAWRHVFLSARSGDLILLAGAGDIINLVPLVRRDFPTSDVRQPTFAELSPYSFFRTGGSTVGGGERAIVGMGSNTWFSDCTTDIEIVRAPADEGLALRQFNEDIPAGTPGAALLATHPELAFMAGIPGTVGGWAKMNAGAFGDSFGNHVEHVVADGRTIPHDECGFGYRASAIRGLITAVRLKGPKDLKGLQDAADYLARRKKFPPRTCGSVFKNPSPEMPAGRLLDEAGAKALRVGGASVWREHANVIVAGDGCTSSDILALARLMARAVFFRTGVRLEPEIVGLTAW
ncbi:MAG: hypothetical protein IJ658_01670, partial [Kiritimatiellae bacterium]|nr:hypothetical protein [Kiritimatiellia bacterium]